MRPCFRICTGFVGRIGDICDIESVTTLNTKTLTKKDSLLLLIKLLNLFNF